MSKKYLDTKEGSLEQSVLGVWQAAVEEQAIRETNKNDKSDDGEGLDAVQPKAVKKKFKDRKDKDIDNDGDVDDSDKFLHKRRKAVSKAVAKEEVEVDESYEMGTDEYRKHTQEVTPGQDITDYQNFKVNSMKEALAKVWGLEEAYPTGSKSGAEVAKMMQKNQTMKAYAPKVAKMKTVTADDLEKMLPDYVSGGDISKLFAGYSYENKTATGEKKDEIDMNPKIGEKKY